MKQSISEKIIRNTIFNIVGRFWGILVTLILMPYIVGHIGVEKYGVWAIVSVVTGYFGLLDFGIRDSFTKFIAEFYTKRDYKKLKQIINTGLINHTAEQFLFLLHGLAIEYYTGRWGKYNATAIRIFL